jgi:hypothetical protein
MSAPASSRKSIKLPKFQSADKGLEEALNMLKDAIEGLTVPDIKIAGGTQDWTSDSVTLRPDASNKTPQLVGTKAPWTPTFEYVDGDWTVRFHLGTVNGVAPSNWNDKHVIPPQPALGDPEWIKYALLTVTTSDGRVTGAVISLSDTAPTEDTVTQDVPPADFVVLLGVILFKSSYMIEVTNLNYQATAVFIESKADPVEGAEPFHRWWRWSYANVY